jgi:hypothetical protein
MRLDDFKRNVHTGTLLRCVGNTYIPDRAGKLATITRAGVGVCDAVMDGKPYRMEWPKRVRDIVSVDPLRITYRIGRDDHTVTWEIVTEPPVAAPLERYEPMRLFQPAPNQIPGQLGFG